MTWVYRGNAASHVVGFCIWTSISDLKFLKRNRIVSIYLTFERKPILKKKFGFSSSFSHFSFFFPTCCCLFTVLHCFASFFTLPLTRKSSSPPQKKKKKGKKRKPVFSVSIKKSILHLNFVLKRSLYSI